ncbi:DnaJ domain-containing protein [Pseudohoeflea coraliihabitans]|uniref:DnaJ domain-containing protein n=1 Tax=Pseudohoeflea coraliihabitans TaxID=2860393 RepID=A0ABS6WPD2_9HYPH|nr:DnaJ domain-containing protein [Pseudohoeflea sp. DP4N28-3]MBW3096945.1 DnaJ domain-containing protein [Pseudohoeflea sp. DP4N28-3]
MRSPYAVLGVARTADTSSIKAAYRTLAKSLHPDQNRDDPDAGSRFAEITQAYKVLIDPQRRRAFDRGEIDAEGRRRPRRGTARGAAKARSARPAQTGADSFDAMVREIFGEDAETAAPASGSKAPDRDPLSALDGLFAKWKSVHRAARENAAEPRTAISEVHVSAEIELESVLTGTTLQVPLEGGGSLPLPVPAGIADGSELTVAKPDMKVIATVRYRPHPSFRVDGADLHTDLAIELNAAVLGGRQVARGLDGPVKITLPEWTTGSEPVRIAGRGLPRGGLETGAQARGDLVVHLHIRLPGQPDAHLVDLLRSKRSSFFI